MKSRKSLTAREKIRLFLIGALMFVAGGLVPTAVQKLIKVVTKSFVQEPLKIYSPTYLKELLGDSPFPPSTRFLGLVRAWNYRWEREMLEMAPFTHPIKGSFVKKFDIYGLPNDSNIPLGKPKDEFRVLVIGDSNTEGYCPNQYAFSQVLEQMLIKSPKYKNRARVINGGMSASGLFELIMRYGNVGKLFEPDVVVFAITLGNDFLDILPKVRPYYIEARKNGYHEMGPVIVYKTKNGKDVWTDKIGLGPETSVDQETRHLNYLPDQPFLPRPLKFTEAQVKALREHERMVENFHNGAFHQGGQQKIYLGKIASLFPELKQRVHYCFWRLAKMLKEEKAPPKVLVMLLPSGFAIRAPEIKGIVQNIDVYLRESDIYVENPEQRIRETFIEAIGEYLHLNLGKTIIDPSQRFKGKEGVFLIKDFHFTVESNRILAEEIKNALEEG